MKKENIQIIHLNTSTNLENHEMMHAKNLQDTASKVYKYILITFATKNKNFSSYKKENIYFINVHRLTFIFYLFKIKKEIKNILNENTKTIITTNALGDLGIIGVIFKFLLRFPLQFQIHTDVFSKYFQKSKFRHLIYFHILKFILHFANSIRVVNIDLKKKLEYKYKNKIIKNIPEIINIKESKNIFIKKRNENIKFLCAARFETEKNLFNMINAFIKFHNKYKNTELKIVGSGSLKEHMMNIIKKENANDFITICDWSNNMQEEYLNTDFTILTSTYEGFGMVVIESMKYGKPFLATPFGGATYYIKENINGFISKNFSCESIFELLEKGYLNKDNFNEEKIKESVKDLTKENMDKELIKFWSETK